MQGNIAKRIGVVLVGYLAAAFASGFVIALMFLTLSSFRDMALDMGFGMLLPVAINLVGVVAAVPAIAIIFIAECGSFRSKWLYLLCGSVIGVSLPPMIIGRFDFSVALFSLVAGAIAGLVYWAIAGRKAGLRPEAPP